MCVICVGDDPGVLRRPGCDHGFMEHEGASAMARRIADRAYPHTDPQSLCLSMIHRSCSPRNAEQPPRSDRSG